MLKKERVTIATVIIKVLVPEMDDYIEGIPCPFKLSSTNSDAKSAS
jgi:hypothetical protein